MNILNKLTRYYFIYEYSLMKCVHTMEISGCSIGICLKTSKYQLLTGKQSRNFTTSLTDKCKN